MVQYTVNSFSPKTLAKLYDAGWSDKYFYDTSEIESANAAIGCPLPEQAIHFLQKFCAIELKNPVHFMDVEFWGEIPRIGLDTCEDYSDCCRLIGLPPQSLYLVGYAALGNVELLMATDGKIYAANLPFLVLLGNNGIEAIEALCTGQELKGISAPTDQ
jgi:hypothetical protein